MKELDEYLLAIKKHYDVSSCRNCDCLQGFLVQLKIDHNLSIFPNIDEMLMPREKQHECLGCDPCPPAEIFTTYLKEKR